MSTATLKSTQPEMPAAIEHPGLNPTTPVSRPKAGLFKMIGEVLNHGGPGYLQFAITNICNAKCDFCGFAVDRFDPKQRRSVTLQEARDVIDICVKNHIGYLLFVGGEPLVHKELRAMTRYAAERGIHPMVCTNGSLWTDQNMRDLAADLAKRAGQTIWVDVCRELERVMEKEKGLYANLDLYGGLVLKLLDIPVPLNTPVFAVSRVAGWCALGLVEGVQRHLEVGRGIGDAGELKRRLGRQEDSERIGAVEARVPARDTA